MEFTTIEQYFYRLFNAVLFILLAPIIIYITVYVTTGFSQAYFESSWTMFALISFAIVTIWISLALIFVKKIKSIPNDQGLGVKLEKYFSLTIVRYFSLSTIGLVLAAFFLITKDDKITLLFAVHLVLCGITWPTSARVCNELKLRGDEREMVYNKKDRF